MIQLPTVSMLLSFESKNDLFSEKLQKFATKLEARYIKMPWANFSFKLFSYVKRMDASNTSTRFCLNILGDTTLESLRSEKKTTKSLVPILKNENLADLFLILPGQLQM